MPKDIDYFEQFTDTAVATKPKPAAVPGQPVTPVKDLDYFEQFATTEPATGLDKLAETAGTKVGEMLADKPIPQQKISFEDYLKKYNVTDANDPQSFYDYKAAYEAGYTPKKWEALPEADRKQDIAQGRNLAGKYIWGDAYKLPGHPYPAKEIFVNPDGSLNAPQTLRMLSQKSSQPGAEPFLKGSYLQPTIRPATAGDRTPMTPMEEAINKQIDARVETLRWNRTTEKIMKDVYGQEQLDAIKKADNNMRSFVMRAPQLATLPVAPIFTLALEGVQQAKNLLVAAKKDEKYSPVDLRMLSELLPASTPSALKIAAGFTESIVEVGTIGAVLNQAKVGTLKATLTELTEKLESAGYTKADLEKWAKGELTIDLDEFMKNTTLEKEVARFIKAKNIEVPAKWNEKGLPDGFAKPAAATGVPELPVVKPQAPVAPEVKPIPPVAPEPIKTPITEPKVAVQHEVVGIDADTGLKIIKRTLPLTPEQIAADRKTMADILAKQKATPPAPKVAPVTLQPSVPAESSVTPAAPEPQPQLNLEAPPATNENDLKAAIEQGGGVYVGLQKEPGYPDQATFNTKDGKTMLLPAGEVTPETVKTKIAETEAKFAEAEPPIEKIIKGDRVALKKFPDTTGTVMNDQPTPDRYKGRPGIMVKSDSTGKTTFWLTDNIVKVSAKPPTDITKSPTPVTNKPETALTIPHPKKYYVASKPDTKGKVTYKEVEGKPVKIKGYEGYDFFAQKTPYGWAISEGKTGGHFTAEERTLTGAIAAGEINLGVIKRKGLNLDDIIKEKLSKYGLSPRYVEVPAKITPTPKPKPATAETTPTTIEKFIDEPMVENVKAKYDYKNPQGKKLLTYAANKFIKDYGKYDKANPITGKFGHKIAFYPHAKAVERLGAEKAFYEYALHSLTSKEETHNIRRIDNAKIKNIGNIIDVIQNADGITEDKTTGKIYYYKLTKKQRGHALVLELSNEGNVTLVDEPLRYVTHLPGKVIKGGNAPGGSSAPDGLTRGVSAETNKPEPLLKNITEKQPIVKREENNIPADLRPYQENIARIMSESPSMLEAQKRIEKELGLKIPIADLKKYEPMFKGGNPSMVGRLADDLVAKMRKQGKSPEVDYGIGDVAQITPEELADSMSIFDRAGQWTKERWDNVKSAVRSISVTQSYLYSDPTSRPMAEEIIDNEIKFVRKNNEVSILEQIANKADNKEAISETLVRLDREQRTGNDSGDTLMKIVNDEIAAGRMTENDGQAAVAIDRMRQIFKQQLISDILNSRIGIRVKSLGARYLVDEKWVSEGQAAKLMKKYPSLRVQDTREAFLLRHLDPETGKYVDEKVLVKNYEEVAAKMKEGTQQIIDELLPYSNWIPHNRIGGKYWVNVYEPLASGSGETLVYSARVPNELWAEKMASSIQEKFPGARIETSEHTNEYRNMPSFGTMADVQYHLNKMGIDPSSDAGQRIMNYYRSMSGTMSSLIHAQNIAGYRVDYDGIIDALVQKDRQAIGRDFRQDSRELLIGTKDIPDVERRNVAVKYVNALSEVTEGIPLLDGIKSFGYFSMLANKPTYIVQNMTEPLWYLARMGTVNNVVKFWAPLGKEYKNMFDRAIDDGILKPYFAEQAGGQGGLNRLNILGKASEAWSSAKCFEIALRQARDKGLTGDQAYRFAYQELYNVAKPYYKEANTLVGLLGKPGGWVNKYGFMFLRWIADFTDKYARGDARTKILTSLGILMLAGVGGVPGGRWALRKMGILKDRNRIRAIRKMSAVERMLVGGIPATLGVDSRFLAPLNFRGVVETGDILKGTNLAASQLARAKRAYDTYGYLGLAGSLPLGGLQYPIMGAAKMIQGYKEGKGDKAKVFFRPKTAVEKTTTMLGMTPFAVGEYQSKKRDIKIDKNQGFLARKRQEIIDRIDDELFKWTDKDTREYTLKQQEDRYK